MQNAGPLAPHRERFGVRSAILALMSTPPDGLPRYRVLTGPDDETFCRRVSEAIDLGYELHQGPAVTFNGQSVIVAQALVWPAEQRPPAE
jgi:hypothetical protein